MTEHAHHQAADAGVAAAALSASLSRTGQVSIVDVAEHILAEQGEMSTMKLHKLLYFSQGWAMAWTGKPLFPEDFEAWASGPVCRELYDLHRGEYSVGPGFFTKKFLASQETRALAESSLR
jgi:uncharacterized phage-associated protein